MLVIVAGITLESQIVGDLKSQLVHLIFLSPLSVTVENLKIINLLRKKFILAIGQHVLALLRHTQEYMVEQTDHIVIRTQKREKALASGRSPLKTSLW